MLKFDSTEWQGIDGLAEELILELRPKAEHAMFDAGTRFQAELKSTLTGTRSGRTYRKPNTKAATYTASAPGEPPASPSGNLRNSMGFSRPKWRGSTIEMEVGSGLGVGSDGKENPAYARRLEFGGSDSRGVMIEARPYMAPAALRMEPILDALFRKAIA